MRVIAILIIAAAAIIAVVPAFANCEAKGPAKSGMNMTTGSMTGGATTAGSMTAGGTAAQAAAAQPVRKMKCLWTARAELAIAIPLGLMGGLLLVARRKETRRLLTLPVATLGIIAILLPTSLIGVCQTSTAICRTTLMPTMIATGLVTVVLAATAFVLNERRAEAAVRLQTAP